MLKIDREASTIQGFNRYIVECKFVKSDIQTLIDKSFNRYIVECKSFWKRNCKLHRWVLIDT